MKAVVFEKSDRAKQLVYRDVDSPQPAGNEVLVKIHAVSVNAADYRSMQLGITPKTGIFGADIAGVITEVGPYVQDLKKGDAVMGDLADSGFGGFAEYTSAKEDLLVLKPENLSFEDAAVIPMAGVTALQALRDKGKIKAGQKVLICGAGGGVGTFGVQLAKHFGAEVTAVCGPNNVETVIRLGADRVIDYSKEDFLQCGNLFDLIVAVNGSHSLSAYKRLLKKHGIYVMVGGGYSQLFRSILFGPVMSLGSRKFLSLSAKPNRKDLDLLVNLASEGKIRPVIERVYSLQQVPEAVKYLQQGHARGKVVIRVVDPQAV